MAKIGVLVPVLNRPERVIPLMRSFVVSCTKEQATLYFVAQQGDNSELRAIMDMAKDDSLASRATLLLVNETKRSWSKKINAGFKSTDESWMLLGADDLEFAPGWVEALEPYMSLGVGVIGTRDEEQFESFAMSCHPLVRRDYVREYGGTLDTKDEVVHEGYDHNYPDTELVATAVYRRSYVFAKECVIKHLHPLTGRAKIDDTYRLGQVKFSDDKKLFHARAKSLGFDKIGELVK
jgi:hypothetical protein